MRTLRPRGWQDRRAGRSVLNRANCSRPAIIHWIFVAAAISSFPFTVLTKLCPQGCEEREDLEKLLATKAAKVN